MGILSMAFTRLKARDTAMMVPLITITALWGGGWVGGAVGKEGGSATSLKHGLEQACQHHLSIADGDQGSCIQDQARAVLKAA